MRLIATFFLGIGWRKKIFRKYFDSEENYTEFHKKAYRLLEAPTVDITRMLQDMIEEWLRVVVEEKRAASWWRDNWCGEHGNYTNATAGYVGNNKSTGIESNWRYMKRDTIGNAGCNKRISLRVFAPSLTQYISDYSKRHADKILLPTGAHRFPMLPTISTTMWGKVQKFDIMRLLLSVCTAGSKSVRRQWSTDLDQFHYADTEGKLYTDVVKEFREAGDRMHNPRSTLEAIIMPTDKMIKTLRRRFAEQDPKFEDYQSAVEIEANAFSDLFNNTDSFHVDYPQYSVDDVLDLMESFHHIKPLPIKSGDQVFLCTCCDAYQKYCCVESTALSLLYNLDFEVPDIARLQQIKEREKAELANPFNSKRLKEKKRKEDKEKEKKEKAAPTWKPHMPVFASCAPGSAADMATQKGKIPSRPVMQEAPPEPPTAVDPPTTSAEPERLVASGPEDPPARRPRSAKIVKPPKVLSGLLLY